MSEETGLIVEFKARYDSVMKGFDIVAKGGKQLEQGFTTLGNKATTTADSILNKYLGLGIGLSAAGIWLYFNHVADSIDKVTDSARGLGVTASDFQKFSYAASLSGVGMDEAGDSLKKFNINVGQALSGNQDAIDSFKAIGISVDQLRGKDLTSQFTLAASAAGNLRDKNIAAAAATTLFGKNYTTALSLGRDGVAQNIAEFDKLGVTLTESQRIAVDQFGDSKTKLSAIFDGFTQKIVADVSPALAKIVGQVSDFIIASGGIDGLATNVADKIVGIVNASTAVFKAIIPIVSALIDNVGFLLEKASALAKETTDSGGIGEDILNRFTLVGKVLSNAVSGNGFSVDPSIVGNYNQSYITASQYAPQSNDNGLASQAGYAAANTIPVFGQILDKTTKAVTALGEASLKSSDLITAGFKSLEGQGKSDELNKIFDIIAKSDDNYGKAKAPDGNFEQWAAELIQGIKGGQLSSSAYNTDLNALRDEARANQASGYDASGQQSVIAEIEKYAASLGTKPQQVEVGITVTPTKDFTIKWATSDDTKGVFLDLVNSYVAESARLGAKS